MNALELVRLKQLRFAVASGLVLREWQPEDLSQPRCPQCYCLGFPTSNQSQGGYVCYCIRCNYYFPTGTPKYTCQCTVPGQDKACYRCPNFERFMELVGKKLVELEHLNFVQLQTLLSNTPSV